MATSKEFCTYVCERLSLAGAITAKKMMGEYCIYLEGKLVALLCDGRLLVKRTPTSDRLLSESPLEYPYSGSKTLMYCVEEFENPDLVTELLQGLYQEL